MSSKEGRVLGRFVYVIPLKRVYWGRRTNRADRAVRLLREFVKRHTKADRVVIMNEVNNYIWSRGREKPPRRVKVVVTLREEEGEEEKEKVAIVRLASDKLKPGPLEVKASK
ncbi:MAG: 50S ribosomal protein L31e [Desulfurococcales archaeon]|nr:50S ribosomal protein L31e [Desulfurococcales archaeon]